MHQSRVIALSCVLTMPCIPRLPAARPSTIYTSLLASIQASLSRRQEMQGSAPCAGAVIDAQGEGVERQPAGLCIAA